MKKKINKKIKKTKIVRRASTKKNSTSLLKYLLILGTIALAGIIYKLIPRPQQADIFVVGTDTGTVTLSLAPTTVNITPNTESTFTLTIDAGTSHATAAQVEIDYDASKIGTPTVTQGDYFTTVISPATVENNKIKFAYSGPTSADAAKTGSGTLATIKIKPTVVGTSTLTFTEATMASVTESTSNSLKSVVNAAINVAETTGGSVKNPVKATGLSHTCSTDGKKVTLKWDDNSPNKTYYVRLNDPRNDTSPIWYKENSTDIWHGGDYPKNTLESTVIPDITYDWGIQTSATGKFDDNNDESEAVTGTFKCSPPAAPQKPSKPTGLRSNCFDGGNKITLRWDAVSGVTSYKVRMDLLSGTPDISVDNITKTEYEAGIKPDQKYSWWVHSSKDGIDSEEAKINEVVCEKPASTPTPTPTATPKSTVKPTVKPTPTPTVKPTPTPKVSVSTPTPKPNIQITNPSPLAAGSLNDIFGEDPSKTPPPTNNISIFKKISLGWQAIFLKLAEIFN